MNLKEINRLMEWHRPLTEIGSLPFLLCGEAGISAHWFNFFVEEGESVSILVTKLFSTSDMVEVSSRALHCSIAIDACQCEEPSMSEAVYLKALEDLSGQFNHDEMMSLLGQTVIAPLMLVYQTVIDEIIKHEAI